MHLHSDKVEVGPGHGPVVPARSAPPPGPVPGWSPAAGQVRRPWSNCSGRWATPAVVQLLR